MLLDLGTSEVPPPLDLSKATKLKVVEFDWNGQRLQWITTALQTTQSEDLQRITVFLEVIFFDPIQEVVLEWQDLDRLLVRLWTSHSIVPEVLYIDELGRFIPNLLPGLTSRGATCKLRYD